MKHNDKILCILENRQREDQRNALRALRDFQQAHQRPETRREFDLSDPLALCKERPPRLGDRDTGASISSLQKFLGEDPERPARIRFQEEQNREWLLQQQKEAQQARASRRSAGRSPGHWVMARPGCPAGGVRRDVQQGCPKVTATHPTVVATPGQCSHLHAWVQ